jgi:hypothetical protein
MGGVASAMEVGKPRSLISRASGLRLAGTDHTALARLLYLAQFERRFGVPA